jgi:hypothetical protein
MRAGEAIWMVLVPYKTSRASKYLNDENHLISEGDLARKHRLQLLAATARLGTQKLVLFKVKLTLACKTASIP